MSRCHKHLAGFRDGHTRWQCHHRAPRNEDFTQDPLVNLERTGDHLPLFGTEHPLHRDELLQLLGR